MNKKILIVILILILASFACDGGGGIISELIDNWDFTNCQMIGEPFTPCFP